MDFVPIRSRYCSGLTQKTVGRYHLDGFRILNDGSKECYKFYECYYHGCPICFPNQSKAVRRKHHENGFHTVKAAYQATVYKEVEIKTTLCFKEGFNKWIVIWEHEYNDNVSIYKEFLGNDLIYKLVDKLNPRDSVKGGKMEVFRMYCCVDDPESEVIRYLDINSLYPYVMAEIEFPIGHPEIRHANYSCRNLLNILKLKKERFIGLCQVRVVPPGGLFMPCLAHKMDGKLLFCLCRTCASS